MVNSDNNLKKWSGKEATNEKELFSKDLMPFNVYGSCNGYLPACRIGIMKGSQEERSPLMEEGRKNLFFEILPNLLEGKKNQLPSIIKIQSLRVSYLFERYQYWGTVHLKEFFPFEMNCVLGWDGKLKTGLTLGPPTCRLPLHLFWKL